MTLHPARLAAIRNHHEHALHLIQHGRTPTTHETLQLIGDLTDLLNEHTNRSHT